MKRLMILTSLLVLLVANAYSYTLKDLGLIPKTNSIPFKQTAINALTKQKIERNGTLTVKKGRYMVFAYKDETVKIENFKVYDTVNGQTKIYPIEGFNQVLYNLFLGKADINTIFQIKKTGDHFTLLPKQKSNIAEVDIYSKDNQLNEIKITDIYGNIITFDF